MTNYKDTLLISPGELKADSLINANVDDKILGYTIQTAQEIYLCKIIGTVLMRKLQELVWNKIQGNDGDNIDTQGYESYKELLEEYVQPYLMYKAMADFVVANSFKFRNIGVVRNSDTNTSFIDLDSIRFLQHHYETYVAEYEDRLSKYICANRESFPEVSAEIPSFMDTPQSGETFSNASGLWLGNIKDKGCGSCRQ